MQVKVTLNEQGNKHSLKRLIAFYGSIIISCGFCLVAYKGRLSAEMFLTYPMGLTILYAPQLAIELIRVWKGNGDIS